MKFDTHHRTTQTAIAIGALVTTAVVAVTIRPDLPVVLIAVIGVILLTANELRRDKIANGSAGK